MMNDQQLTKRAADALATLIAELRDDWDRTGIITALRQAHQLRTSDPWRLTLAAITAARDPNTKTPALIAHKGPHWQLDTSTAPAADRTCPTCRQWHAPTENCPQRSERVHSYAEQARQLLHEAKGTA